MRILHILDHSLPLHSGYTFRSQSIFKAQANRGWELAVVTSPKHQESWKGEWESQEIVGDFLYYRTPLSVPRTYLGYYEFRLILALSRRIREVASIFKPDVIHAHSPVLNAVAALRTHKKLGIPLIYEIRAFWEDAAADHGTYGENSWRYRFVRGLETWLCGRADHVTVICNGLRQDLIDRGLSSDKISVVPNGIDIEEFNDCDSDKQLRVQYSLKDKKIIAFLGSFYRYEGLDLAVDAFRTLAEKYKDWILLLAGGGEMEAFLKEKVRELGLNDRVLFPGRIPHERIPGVYALSDILIYPRYSMRLTELVTPLKPLEAMAMGKPIVASDVGGHKELIIDGRTGVLFPAGNATALASSIESMIIEKDPTMRLAQRGRDWVRKERTWEKTTEVCENVYQRVLREQSTKVLKYETTS